MLCALLFITSCGETDKDRINRLVKEWEGKEIKFPSHSTFTVLGKDTVDFTFADADYKVLTYIDSVGCASCELDFSRWVELIHDIDSLTDGKVPFLFYFHPMDMRELKTLVYCENFTYPICFDESDELNKLNNFSIDVAFQSFLLNQENRVIAMGNPTHGPKIKDLYLSIITGRELVKKGSLKTKVAINKKEIEFGNFPQLEKQEHSFVLTNKGNHLLVIQDVTTSCGCTKVEYNKEPVRPGGTLELKVIYEAEQAERFNKAITIYCNADNSPLRLTIKGNAE